MISSNTCDRARACRTRAGLRGTLALALLLAPGVATAAPAAGDRAAAEALFNEGRKLVEAGDDAGGCPKFESSMALFPSTGTALNLAQCHERAGKLASAYAAYQAALDYVDETRDARRRKGLEKLARDGQAALEPRLPRLQVDVKNAPAGLAVIRDGQPLAADALGKPVPTDPGPHQLDATAPGHQPLRREIELTEGKTETVELQLEPLHAEAPVEKKRRVPAWAWATGGVGLGLMGASIYFLVDNRAAVADLKANCQDVPGGTFCDPNYDFAADNARKNRDLGLFIGLGSVGLVAVTVAIVEIARTSAGNRRAARKAMATPWLTPGAGGLSIVGRF
ncbi:hypothetical protein [Nannocystis bainbridge]|uniref:PEGA domain-containing protein n=1 Tax=Nannocystis bainbridge TaxID=2995303 RepID=A0ABT5E6K4_9BACT|nr:hypothetical protein [Nannocystis bainbridge]MDC0721492.1 hypothetical protein [Nannocystis bainbridge]